MIFKTDEIIETLNGFKKSESQYTIVNYCKLNSCNSDGSPFYFGVDSDGYFIFVTDCNALELSLFDFSTSKLIYRSSISAYFNINDVEEKKVVNIVTCLSSDNKVNHAFIQTCEMFIESGENDLKLFLRTLKNLFSDSIKTTESELKGLFGELYLIKYFHDLKIDILKYWQSKDKMKHDFSLINSKKIEVKSTESNVRTHHFKLDQISGGAAKILIASIMLRSDVNGLTLLKLIDEIQMYESFSIKHNNLINSRIINADQRIIELINYDEAYLFENIRFYYNSEIGDVRSSFPDYIYNIELDICFDSLSSVSISNVLTWLEA